MTLRLEGRSVSGDRFRAASARPTFRRSGRFPLSLTDSEQRFVCRTDRRIGPCCRPRLRPRRTFPKYDTFAERPVAYTGHRPVRRRAAGVSAHIAALVPAEHPVCLSEHDSNRQTELIDARPDRIPARPTLRHRRPRGPARTGDDVEQVSLESRQVVHR